MIPKHIIEKAIEGGWRENMHRIVMEKSYCMLFSERLSTYPTMIYYAEIILDPLFWQSLGKALRWYGDNPEPDKKHLKGLWIEYAHEFFDLLLTGDDTKKFWVNLIK